MIDPKQPIESPEDTKAALVTVTVLAVSVVAGLVTMVAAGWRPSLYYNVSRPEAVKLGAFVMSVGFALAAFHVGRRWWFETPMTYWLMVGALAAASFFLFENPLWRHLPLRGVRFFRETDIPGTIRFLLPSVLGWAASILRRVLREMSGRAA